MSLQAIRRVISRWSEASGPGRPAALPSLAASGAFAGLSAVLFVALFAAMMAGFAACGRSTSRSPSPSGNDNALRTRQQQQDPDPAEEAAKHGFQRSPGPNTRSPYSPFVRMIRENADRPIESRGCARIEFATGVGRLKTDQKTKKTNRPFYANPYIYASFEMKLANGTEEYIEAGMGYTGDDPRGPFMAPYLRRAPDDAKIDDTLPPEGWKMRRGIRDGVMKDLPGYWAASTDDLRRLLAMPAGEFCWWFRFDEASNRYLYDSLIRTPAEGVAAHAQHLEMPSVRKTLAPGSDEARITSFHTRLLTSIAITDDEYDPANPIFDRIGVGVRWKAEVRDSRPGSAWEPIAARDFTVINADPKGAAIYYELGQARPGEIPLGERQ